MDTIYDWATVALFAGLIVLFLQRSDAAVPRDTLGQYLVAIAGCAGVNWLGNQGHHLLAIPAGVLLIVFIWRVLQPFHR